MESKKWTETEIDYFRQGLSDVEIANKTGRTALAVVLKRRRLGVNTQGAEDTVVPPCLLMLREEKIERIHKLAERYGVKLL